jgi:SAM-dependent methyltransferase
VSALGTVLSRWLALPQTAESDLDDPRTTALRRQIIQDKAFLKRIYEDWYDAIAAAVPTGDGRVLELGSGGGFIRTRIRDVIASDVMTVPGLDITADGTRLPFRHGALRAIVMTNVFHHIPDPRAFFEESARCVRPGGRLVLLEPWVTSWSRVVYRYLHHEPFDPAATDWRLTSSGPLSGANGALPWMVFERDRALFQRDFPTWRVSSVDVIMPFRYLVSGGVSLRSLAPAWSYGAWRAFEASLGGLGDRLGMFARIVVTRTAIGGHSGPGLQS